MKKGESALTFVFSLIFLGIILSLFYFLFLKSSISKSEYAINSINIGDTNINLINYIKTPLEDNSNIYDLIINSYYNNKYEKLDGVTLKIFNEVYDKEKCPLWNIKGEVDGKEFFEYESEFDIRKYTLNPNPRNILQLFNKNYLIARSSSIDLMLPDKTKKMKITLTEGCLNE